MPVIDSLFSIGRIRKAIWQLWYPFLTRRLRGQEVLFLNYAYEEEPPMGIPLQPDDEPNRACIQLYHHVATQIPLRGKQVLEVSCGHGGGAAYLARTLQPGELHRLGPQSRRNSLLPTATPSRQVKLRAGRRQKSAA